LAGDEPVLGDWNGDGRTQIGVKRGKNWYFDYNSNGRWDGCRRDRCYVFGFAADLPVAGDWNGDGFDEIGVFRSGKWYLDYNGNGRWDGCGSTPSKDRCYAFGFSTDQPVSGNW
jgi:hypothetical protein